MNEEISSWENTLKNDTISIYRRQVHDSPSFVIKAIAEIDNVSKDDVYFAIYDTKKRMSWDKVFKEFKIIIPESTNQNEIIYMSVKVSII